MGLRPVELDHHPSGVAGNHQRHTLHWHDNTQRGW
jgi:hypothetical protein